MKNASIPYTFLLALAFLLPHLGCERKKHEENAGLEAGNSLTVKRPNLEDTSRLVFNSRTITLPAPPGGISLQHLGVPHNEELRPIGRLHEKPDSRWHNVRSHSRCVVTSSWSKSTLEHRLELAIFGLGSTNSADSSSTTSLRHTVRCSEKTVSLNPGSPIELHGPALVPIEIVYGWAYHHLFWGSADAVNEGLVAAIKNVGISAAIEQRAGHVQSKHTMLGFKRRDSCTTMKVQSEADIQDCFEKSPGSEPILVRYAVVNMDEGEKLRAQAFGQLREGTYSVKIEGALMRRRPGFGSWDPDGNRKPDPGVEFWLNGKLEIECRAKDVRLKGEGYEFNCPGTITIRQPPPYSALIRVGDLHDKQIWSEVRLSSQQLRVFENVHLPTRPGFRSLSMRLRRKH